MAIEYTTEQLDEMWSTGQTSRTAIQKREKYYGGDHDITDRVAGTDVYADGEDKSAIVSNFIKPCVNMYVGALTTVPFQITLDDQELGGDGPAKYKEISDDQKLKSKDVVNLRNAITYGFSVETHEFHGGKPVIKIHDSDEWGLIPNEVGDIVLVFRRVTLAKNSVHKEQILDQAKDLMYVYTDTEVAVYEKENGTTTWQEPTRYGHKYGRLPVVIWKVEEDRSSMITDDQITMQDEYNDIDTISGDDIRNNTNAKLKVKGYDMEDVDDNAETIKQKNIIPLGDDGDADYIMKGNDVERIESRLKRSKQAIYTAMQCPDIESIVGVTGGTSGIALLLKFLPMMQRASSMINYIKDGLKDRIDLLNRVLEPLGERIDNTTETIQFVIPSNRTEEWQAIKNLDGVVTKLKQLELLSDIDDPQEELAALEKELAANPPEPTDQNSQEAEAVAVEARSNEEMVEEIIVALGDTTNTKIQEGKAAVGL